MIAGIHDLLGRFSNLNRLSEDERQLPDNRSFHRLYSRYRAQVDECLERVVDRKKEPLSVYEPIRYALGSGGKRLRAVLVLLACEAVGGRAKDALGAAVAIELLHNFTLIHDDVMDNAALRRNRPTVHAKWDGNVAILAGDELIAQAYRYLSDMRTERNSELLRVFTNAFIEVCEGQALDREYEGRPRVSIDDYLLMIQKKTARVIAASIELGGLIGQGSVRNVAALRRFGEHLGIAFQIQDDILDITGDPEEFGKTMGGDIKQGKKTYLLVTALERCTGIDRKLLRSIVPGNGMRESQIEQVRLLYEREGIIDDARAAVERETRKAERALGSVRSGRAKEMLIWIARQLLDRQS